MILELKNITFGYDDKEIFSNLSLCIARGDYIGIFGENGKGKTTLLKIILSILKPGDGEVIWYDEAGKAQKRNPYSIQYISQKGYMLDSIIPITVREVLSISRKYSDSQRVNAKDKTCSYETIESALSHVGLITYIDVPFKSLSEGQKQRALIAKALIETPDIIMLDEPTASIDIPMQQSFYELLDHLRMVHHITILFISHDIRFLREKVERIWYVGEDTSPEIMKIFPKSNVEFLHS